jgi:prevent-host-death family protein
VAKLKPTEDIHPLSDFRSTAAAFVERVQSTRRPVILTQRGRSAAVLMDVAEYEALVEELELLRDIRTAEKQLAAGKGLAPTAAKRRVRAALKR